jgi:RND family efflux transporter MFP subunit
MNKRVIIIALGAVVLVALGAMKLMSNKKEVEAKLYIRDASEAILVDVAQPKSHTFESSLSFLGTFDAAHQNNVASDGSGKLIKLLVEEGDVVSTGQMIAKLDDELIQLQIQEAQLNLDNLKNDNARYSSLKKDNVIASAEVEKIELAVKTTEVKIKQLQRQLRSTSIVAPFNGIVSKRMVDLGSMIMPGTPIVELTDISSLKLTISVPERDVLKFTKGQTIAANVDVYGDVDFNGKITQIAVQADAAHNFKIQATVQNSGTNRIMAGMYGSVSLSNSKSTTALAVPRKALIGSSKNPQVYVVRNGKAILTSFNAGTSDGDYIEVISGLTKSDKIVTKGQVNLQNNANVKTTK